MFNLWTKKSKWVQINIKPRDPAKPLTGANTLVELDGKPVKGCSKISFEVAAGVGTIKMELYGTVAVSGLMVTEVNIVEPKAGVVPEIGKLDPACVHEKP